MVGESFFPSYFQTLVLIVLDLIGSCRWVEEFRNKLLLRFSLTSSHVSQYKWEEERGKMAFKCLIRNVDSGVRLPGFKS